jgi:hypothetical protein
MECWSDGMLLNPVSHHSNELSGRRNEFRR